MPVSLMPSASQAEGEVQALCGAPPSCLRASRQTPRGRGWLQVVSAGPTESWKLPFCCPFRFSFSTPKTKLLQSRGIRTDYPSGVYSQPLDPDSRPVLNFLWWQLKLIKKLTHCFQPSACLCDSLRSFKERGGETILVTGKNKVWGLLLHRKVIGNKRVIEWLPLSLSVEMVTAGDEVKPRVPSFTHWKWY